MAGKTFEEAGEVMRVVETEMIGYFADIHCCGNQMSFGFIYYI